MKADHNVVIFGSEKMAQLCHFFLTHDSPYRVAAVTVDGKYVNQKELWGLPLVPFEEIENVYSPDRYKMFIAVGYQGLNLLRATKCQAAREKGYELISYISSKATVWGDAKIGDNCFISENTVIAPWTTIGNDVLIKSSVYIGHDVSIGDHCWISSHCSINGFVTIEPHCFIGSNATLRDEVTIKRECIIGAGAVILNDTKEKEVYVSKRAELFPLDSPRFMQIMGI